jgi:hypothetical protein
VSLRPGSMSWTGGLADKTGGAPVLLPVLLLELLEAGRWRKHWR